MDRVLKSFFREPTAAEIKHYSQVSTFSSRSIDEIVDRILAVNENEAIILETQLIPTSYKTSRKFMKHGKRVELRGFDSIAQARNLRITPVQLREEAFNGVRKDQPYSAYSYNPLTGDDLRLRVVSLVECVEGARIYGYARQPTRGFKPKFGVTPYDQAKRVQLEGAEVLTRIPSRSTRMPGYESKFMGVIVEDVSDKWAAAYSLNTTHQCKHKNLGRIRYVYLENRESSRAVYFCAHDAAGNLFITDHYWVYDKNLIPLQMNLFAIPTQETVDYYSSLLNNVLIKTPDTTNPRKLNNAEKEILLWGLVAKLGHDKTFFARDKIRDYDWHVNS